MITMENVLNNPSSRPNRHLGPSLLLVAIIYIVLVIAGIFVGVILIPHNAFAMPTQPVQRAITYFSLYSSQARWLSFFELSSAIPLGIFTATVVSRLRFLGVRAAGELIALYGGMTASAMLIVSALCGWALTTPGITDLPGAVRSLQLLSFATGGPGFVIPLGLLLAGVSVTSGFYRLLPRWLVILGIVVAVASELATFSLVTWKASYFIPVGRFVSFIWMIGVGITMPATKDSNARIAEKA
jgi:hypothetical protein